ncbi:hypothetical protein PRZ48_014929 [Zasmidium cellare]|uniref:Uncharacterized protein n=1 Tax=Zasmidium cellare TaxID=395010 RepID=A0ABR0DX54_ZASCE|nr:hypothetical protein PRZ48_014929 [Zasmidium cellare]
MSSRTKTSKVREQDVDAAFEKATKSLDKYYKALGELNDLRDQIEECEDDMEEYQRRLHYRKYSTTQEKFRLEDKFNLARRHKEYLKEQHDRAHGRLGSAKDTLDRHREQYRELDEMFEYQEDKRMARAFRKLEEEERERRRWRRYVDDCFANYSQIKEFPHPPIHGRDVDHAAWEKDLKTLFRSLEGVDLKKESFRWHPDRFSACEEGKREMWKGFAGEVFVVISGMVKEK